MKAVRLATDNLVFFLFAARRPPTRDDEQRGEKGVKMQQVTVMSVSPPYPCKSILTAYNCGYPRL